MGGNEGQHLAFKRSVAGKELSNFSAHQGFRFDKALLVVEEFVRRKLHPCLHRTTALPLIVLLLLLEFLRRRYLHRRFQHFLSTSFSTRRRCRCRWRIRVEVAAASHACCFACSGDCLNCAVRLTSAAGVAAVATVCGIGQSFRLGGATAVRSSSPPHHQRSPRHVISPLLPLFTLYPPLLLDLLLLLLLILFFWNSSFLKVIRRRHASSAHA
mmetsp:Transcript_8146/g.14924  ORF Transcript_8146/g.14924 Transcript_8146/m.14924 type:complete len:213 (+) Transcript_8146:1-639(+)